MKLEPWLIIHQAIAIYRSNFRRFFSLSLSATVWFIVANFTWFLFIITSAVIPFYALIFFTFSEQFLPKNINSFLVLLIGFISLCLTLALSIYSSAKGLLQEKKIGHIAYQYIIGEPELPQANFRQNRQQFWQFWLTRYYRSRNPFLYVAILVTSFLGVWSILPATLISIWISGGSYLSSMFISIHRYNARDALKISQRQLEPHMLQIFLISLSVIGLAIPQLLLGFSPALAVGLNEWYDLKDTLPTMDSVLHFIEALGLSIILSTLLNCLLTPLVGSIEAVIYTLLNPLRPDPIEQERS